MNFIYLLRTILGREKEMIPFNPWEWHHLYLGIVIAIIALIFEYRALKRNDFGGTIVWFAIALVGALIISDDLHYHIYGESGMHTFYSKFLYQFGWVRKLNDWLDWLFGKR
jgi:hypothetical protein